MLVLAVYLFAGSMHGLCGLDVTNAGEGGSTFISMVEKATGHADKGVCADDKCHGCFSVSLPNVAFVTAITEVATRNPVHHDAARRGLAHAIEPPPPRILT